MERQTKLSNDLHSVFFLCSSPVIKTSKCPLWACVCVCVCVFLFLFFVIRPQGLLGPRELHPTLTFSTPMHSSNIVGFGSRRCFLLTGQENKFGRPQGARFCGGRRRARPKIIISKKTEEIVEIGMELVRRKKE